MNYEPDQWHTPAKRLHGPQQIESELDSGELTAERQDELERAYSTNVVAGRQPYAGVRIKERREVDWVMRRRLWGDTFYEREDGTMTSDFAAPNFSAANLTGVDLSGLSLARANLRGAQLVVAHLRGTDLSDADLSDANLSGVDASQADFSRAILVGAKLVRADLSRAQLCEANLTGANLRYARLQHANLGPIRYSTTDPHVPGDEHSVNVILSGVDLAFAELFEADLTEVDLSGANLSESRLDVTTRLIDVIFDGQTRIADVIWNGVPLARVDWDKVPSLGDEAIARALADADGSRKDRDKLWRAYATAARGYQQLAMALGEQGQTEYADRYAYRAQRLRRVALRMRRKWERWLVSVSYGLSRATVTDFGAS